MAKKTATVTERVSRIDRAFDNLERAANRLQSTEALVPVAPPQPSTEQLASEIIFDDDPPPAPVVAAVPVRRATALDLLRGLGADFALPASPAPIVVADEPAAPPSWALAGMDALAALTPAPTWKTAALVGGSLVAAGIGHAIMAMKVERELQEIEREEMLTAIDETIAENMAEAQAAVAKLTARTEQTRDDLLRTTQIVAEGQNASAQMDAAILDAGNRTREDLAQFEADERERRQDARDDEADTRAELRAMRAQQNSQAHDMLMMAQRAEPAPAPAPAPAAPTPTAASARVEAAAQAALDLARGNITK